MVQTSSTITTPDPFSKAFNPLSGAVLLFRFADKKTVNFAAGHGNGNDDRIGSHGQAADSLRPPSALPNFFEKYLAGQPRTASVQSRGAAIDVVVAGPPEESLDSPSRKDFRRQRRNSS